jgi:glycosyltransferase involved in cell wall biosynthesis
LKPSILIIVNRLVISGQSPDTLSLAWYLRNDFDITILYGKKEPDEEDALYLLEKYPGLNVKKIDHLQRSFSFFTDIKAFITLFRFIKNARPDLVHTHGSKSGLLGRIAARLAGVKVIIHTYHGHFFHSYYGRFKSRIVILGEKILAKITTACIVLSKSQFNEIIFKYKITSEQKAALIPLGFNALQFSGTGVDNAGSFWQQQCKLPPGKIVVAIIGRIVPVKNHIMFLEAAEILLRSNDNIVFLIVGDGYLRKKLEAYLHFKKSSFENLSYKEGVHFIFAGWQKNIDDILSAVDIVALNRW